LVYDFGLSIYLCISNNKKLDLGSNYPVEFVLKRINKLRAIVQDNTLGASIMFIDIDKE
jgi:hypothetical protein